MIVVDTSVWSRALRRPPDQADQQAAASAITSLVQRNEPLALPGVVLQELLSGVRSGKDFTRLQEVLAPFPLLLADREHHLAAAEIFNSCRARGLNISSFDALVAATAVVEGAVLLTADGDFVRIAEHCPQLRVTLLEGEL